MSLTAFLRPSLTLYSPRHRSTNDAFSPTRTNPAAPRHAMQPARINTSSRSGLPGDPANWTEHDLATYARKHYQLERGAPLLELIKNNRLTPPAVWYLQSDAEELGHIAGADHLLREGLEDLAHDIKPVVSPTSPRRMNAMQLSVLLDVPEPAPPSPPPPEEPELEEEEDEDVAQSVVSDWALDEQMGEEAEDEHEPVEVASEGTERAAEDGDAPAGPPPAGGALGLDTTGGQQHQQEAPQPEPAAEYTEPPAVETEVDLNTEQTTEDPSATYDTDVQALRSDDTGAPPSDDVHVHVDSEDGRSAPLHDDPSAQEDGGEVEEPEPSQPEMPGAASEEPAPAVTPVDPAAPTEAIPQEENPASEGSGPFTSTEEPETSEEHHTTAEDFGAESGTGVLDGDEDAEGTHEAPPPESAEPESGRVTEEPAAEEATFGEPVEAAHAATAEETRLDLDRERQSSETPAESGETPAAGDVVVAEEHPSAAPEPPAAEEGASTSDQAEAPEAPLVDLGDDNGELNTSHDSTTTFGTETHDQGHSTDETPVEQQTTTEDARAQEPDSSAPPALAEGATGVLVDFSTDEPAPASEPLQGTSSFDLDEASHEPAGDDAEGTTTTTTASITAAFESAPASSLSTADTPNPAPELTIDTSMSPSDSVVPPTPTITQQDGSNTPTARKGGRGGNKGGKGKRDKNKQSRNQTPVPSESTTPARAASPAPLKVAPSASPSASASPVATTSPSVAFGASASPMNRFLAGAGSLFGGGAWGSSLRSPSPKTNVGFSLAASTPQSPAALAKETEDGTSDAQDRTEQPLGQSTLAGEESKESKAPASESTSHTEHEPETQTELGTETQTEPEAELQTDVTELQPDAGAASDPAVDEENAGSGEQAPPLPLSPIATSESQEEGQQEHQRDQQQDQQDSQDPEHDQQPSGEAPAQEVDVDEAHDDGVLVSPVAAETPIGVDIGAALDEVDSTAPNSTQDSGEGGGIQSDWLDLKGEEASQEPAQDQEQAQAHVDVDVDQAVLSPEGGEGSGSAQVQTQDAEPVEGDAEDKNDNEDDEENADGGPRVDTPGGGKGGPKATKKKVGVVNSPANLWTQEMIALRLGTGGGDR
ncbi:hypothetical protein C2E23DRAFT_861331 [Lenzites betulinus]|nr:hypothetical protein C2E23DRAFT_861331 [Lenzites betulinus]